MASLEKKTEKNHQKREKYEFDPMAYIRAFIIGKHLFWGSKTQLQAFKKKKKRKEKKKSDLDPLLIVASKICKIALL